MMRSSLSGRLGAQPLAHDTECVHTSVLTPSAWSKGGWSSRRTKREAKTATRNVTARDCMARACRPLPHADPNPNPNPDRNGNRNRMARAC